MLLCIKCLCTCKSCPAHELNEGLGPYLWWWGRVLDHLGGRGRVLDHLGWRGRVLDHLQTISCNFSPCTRELDMPTDMTFCHDYAISVLAQGNWTCAQTWPFATTYDPGNPSSLSRGRGSRGGRGRQGKGKTHRKSGGDRQSGKSRTRQVTSESGISQLPPNDMCTPKGLQNRFVWQRELKPSVQLSKGNRRRLRIRLVAKVEHDILDSLLRLRYTRLGRWRRVLHLLPPQHLLQSLLVGLSGSLRDVLVATRCHKKS